MTTTPACTARGDRLAERIDRGGLGTAWPSERLMTRMPYLRAIGNGPIDPGDDVARVADARGAENAHVNEVHAGRAAASECRGHVFRGGRVARDDSGDVRAVAVRVAVDVPSHDTRLTRAITRASRAECGEMPESTTATPMPLPS